MVVNINAVVIINALSMRQMMTISCYKLAIMKIKLILIVGLGDTCVYF